MAAHAIASDGPSAAKAAAPSTASAPVARRAVATSSGNDAMRAIARDNLAALTGHGQELVAKAERLDMEIGLGLSTYSGPYRSATRNMRMVSALFTGTV